MQLVDVFYITVPNFVEIGDRDISYRYIAMFYVFLVKYENSLDDRA